MKHMIAPMVILLALVSNSFQCSVFKTQTGKRSTPPYIIIEDGGSAQRGVMHLNENHSTMTAEIKSNTLNDTAIWYTIKIAPGQTGRLFKDDCYMDSSIYHYTPYKATKGKLVIEYHSN